MQQFDASSVRAWCRAAADGLLAARDRLDTLNVFPVADADTGANLAHTMTAAASGAQRAAGDDAAAVWADAARAALAEAHGNSGVVLGELLRGFAEVAPADGAGLARALRRAADLAYAAVADPVEGTILTVARAAADGAATGDASLAGVADAAARGAREALERTPLQLPPLAEAGVVDAGGAGLVVVLDALALLCAGKSPADPAPLPTIPAPLGPGVDRPGTGGAYEVMYLLDADGTAAATLRAELAALGDSLVVAGGNPWSVHVHTPHPGQVVEAGLRAGRPYRVRVTHLADALSGRRVVVALSYAGLCTVFQQAGATVVATEAGAGSLGERVRAAVRPAPGAQVILLPNDGAALDPLGEIVADWRRAGARAAVVPSRAQVQGLAALAVHDAGREFDDDVVAMTAAAATTRHAVLDPPYGDPVTAAVDTVDRLVAGGCAEMVTLVTGACAPAGLGEQVVARLAACRPGLETIVYDGGQPDHVLLVGVE
ncbi:MAG: DAK2 domain-containing protein [Streptosporangiales bacterium]